MTIPQAQLEQQIAYALSNGDYITARALAHGIESDYCDYAVGRMDLDDLYNAFYQETQQ